MGSDYNLGYSFLSRVSSILKKRRHLAACGVYCRFQPWPAGRSNADLAARNAARAMAGGGHQAPRS